MKKLFTFIVGAAVSLGAYAQDFDSGDLRYSVLSPDDKTCAVTGYTEIGSVLEIPEKVSFEEEEYTVTKIGERAFQYTGANTIIFPSTLEVIGDNAFFNCNGLRELVIPNSVKEIGMWSFYACYDLTKLELGSSIEKIGAGAFVECPLYVAVVSGEKPAQFYDGYANSFSSNPLVAVPESVVAEYQAAWLGANIVPNIPAESVSFDPDYYSVQPGKSVQLNCVAYPENAPVNYSTWNTDIISVDNNGLVTALPLRGG